MAKKETLNPQSNNPAIISENSGNSFAIKLHGNLSDEKFFPEPVEYQDFKSKVDSDDQYVENLYSNLQKDGWDLDSFDDFKIGLKGEDPVNKDAIILEEPDETDAEKDFGTLPNYQGIINLKNKEFSEKLPAIYDEFNNIRNEKQKELMSKATEDYNTNVEEIRNSTLYAPLEKNRAIENYASGLNDRLTKEMESMEESLSKDFDFVTKEQYDTNKMFDQTPERREILDDYVEDIKTDGEFANLDFDQKNDFLRNMWLQASQELSLEMAKTGEYATEDQLMDARQEFYYNIGKQIMHLGEESEDDKKKREKRNKKRVSKGLGFTMLPGLSIDQAETKREKSEPITYNPNDLSAYAIKTQLSETLENIDKALSDDKMKAVKEVVDYDEKIRASHGRGGVSTSQLQGIKDADISNPKDKYPWMTGADLSEYKMLKNAKESSEVGMNIPEDDIQGLKELWSGLTGDKGINYLPFISSFNSMSTNIDKLDVAKKLKNSEPLSESEKLFIQATNLPDQLLEASPNSAPGSAFRIGRGVGHMLPYMAEFGITAGVGTSVRAALKVSLNTTGKLAWKNAGQKTFSFMVGALAQTAANPQQYANATMERMTPQMSLMMSEDGNEFLAFVDSQGENFGEAFAKGFGLTYAEFLTESMGAINMRGAKYIGNATFGKPAKWAANKLGVEEHLMKQFSNPDFIKRSLLAKWMKKQGFKDGKQARNFFLNEKMGWHGFMEEYSEEFINARLGDLITGDNPDFSRGQAMLPWNYNLAQELETLAIIGVAQGARLPISAMPSKRSEGRSKYSWSDASGNKKSAWLHDDHVEIAKNAAENATPDNLKAFKKLQNDKTLTKDQQSLVNTMFVKSMMNKVSKDIDETVKEDPKPDSKESKNKESKTIKPKEPIDEEKNKRIVEEFSELEDTQFLEDENIGKRIPAKSELVAEAQSLRSQLSEVGYDPKKPFTDQGEDVIDIYSRLQNVESVLKNYDERVKKVNTKKKEETGFKGYKAKKAEEPVEDKKPEEKKEDKKVSDIEAKKADIKKRRKEELTIDGKLVYETGKDRSGKEYPGGWIEHKEQVDKKYDSELAELEKKDKPVEKKKPQAKQSKLPKSIRKKIVYASTTSGKTTFIENNPGEKILDGDKVLKETLVRMGYEKELKNTSPGLLAYKLDLEGVEVKSEFQKNVKIAKKNGYTILGANNFLREIADTAYLSESAEDIVERSKDRTSPITKRKAQAIIDKEKRELKGVPTQTIPKGSYISEVLSDVPKKKGVSASDQLTMDLKTVAKIADKESKVDPKKTKESALIDFLDDLKFDDEGSNTFVKKAVPEGDTETIDAFKSLATLLPRAIWNGIIEVAKVGVKAGYSIAKIIGNIKKYLENTDWYKSLDAMEAAMIMAKISSGMKVAISKFKKDTMSTILDKLSNEDVVSLSNEGNRAHMRTWGPVWRDISKSVGTSRDMVEREMLRIAKVSGFGNLKNAKEYKTFVKNLLESVKDSEATKDKIHNELYKFLNDLAFDQAVSLFNYYSSLNLVSHHAFIIDKNGMKLNIINPTSRISDFIYTFNKHIRSYVFNENKAGHASVAARTEDYIKWKNQKLGRIITKKGVKTRENYDKLSDKEKTALRKELFQAELKFLEDITGIQSEVWRDYFTAQTKETLANTPSKNNISFESYDDLLEQEVTRKFKGDWLRFESNLLHNFITSWKNSHGVKAEKLMIQKFFTKGDKAKDVLSNLYKLSTIKLKSGEGTLDQQVDATGMSGKSVMGKRFSSLFLNSHLMKSIRNIRKSNNSLGKFYNDNNIDPQLHILDGMRNIASKKDAIETNNMNEDDLIIASLVHFLEYDEENQYLQNLGQFSDKSTMYHLPVPKYKKVDEKWVKEKFIDFEQNVQIVYNAIKGKNAQFFQNALEKAGFDKNSKEGLKVLARQFVYNNARNSVDIVEIIHGDLSSYEKDGKFSYTDMVKRAGSINSPGYNVNSSIEGGIGKNYNHAVAQEWEHISEELEKFGLEIFDGISFMSSAFAEKLSVSMGSVYAKEDMFGHLSSVKALISNTKDGARGLTKTNWVTIDVLAETFPDSVLSKIKSFMDKNGLDTLSFDSGTKKFEQKSSFKLFDKNGKIASEYKKADHKMTRETEDLYIQQDLRHASDAKESKATIQFFSNILKLPNGKGIQTIVNAMKHEQLRNIEEEYLSLTKEELIAKLKKNIDPINQQKLIDLLDAGVSINEPAVAKLLKTILASAVTNDALQVFTNRSVTQELPAIPGLLREMQIIDWNGEKKVLLPQIGISDPNVRIDQDFGTNAKAIQHITDNEKMYPDMFTLDGALKEWEIINGVIPGEYILSTRIPSDDLHSHTLARASHRFASGNFTMLDKRSQKISGSDYDGDQRFNTVVFKDKNDIPFSLKEGKGKKSRANQILSLLAEDYSNPAYFDMINEPIDTGILDPKNNLEITYENFEKLFLEDPNNLNNIRIALSNKERIAARNNIIKGKNTKQAQILKNFIFESFRDDGIELVTGNGNATVINYYRIKDFFNDKGFLEISKKQQSKDYDNALGIDSFLDSRNKNMVGDKMKGLLTDVSTIFSYLSFAGTGFKSIIGVAKAKLSGIVKDRYNLVKAMLGNLLNMAYDNAKDPKIETNGLNEVTAPMFSLYLMSNLELDKAENKEEYKKLLDSHLANAIEFFTSPLVKDFVKYKRKANGGLQNISDVVIKEWLKADHSENAVNALFDLSIKSSDILSMRSVLSLTQKAALNTYDLWMAKRSLAKIRENKLLLFDTTDIDPDKVLYGVADHAIQVLEDTIFSNTFENSQLMQGVLTALSNSLDISMDKLLKDHGKVIIAAINDIAMTKALSDGNTFKSIERRLFGIQKGNTKSNFQILKESKPDNIFYQFIDEVQDTATGEMTLQINEDFKYGIDDILLKEIYKSFDELSPNLKMIFSRYALSQYGAYEGNSTGNFYSLISPSFRAEISKKMDQELSNWTEGNYSLEEQFIIFSTLQPFIQDIMDESPNAELKIDNALALPGNLMSYEAYEELTKENIDYGNIDDIAMNELIKSKDFSNTTVTKLKVVENSKKDQTLAERLYNIFLSFEKNTKDFFALMQPKETPSVKNMMGTDKKSEVLASTDPELQKFIMEKLQKAYPGLHFFSSREAFEEFVQRNYDKGFRSDGIYIGHAIGNAVFIDPLKAVQSTIIHEHGHIYWGALPNDNKIKKALIDLYNKEHPGLNEAEIEEMIMLDLGMAGIDMAKVQLKGNALTRFKALLKRLWQQVKLAFGKASMDDYIDILTHQVWVNKKSIDSKTIDGKNIVNNMLDPNPGKVSLDKESHSYTVGRKTYISATQSVANVKSVDFDKVAMQVAEASSNKLSRLMAISDSITPEQLADIQQNIKGRWNRESVAGDAIHAVSEETIRNHNGEAFEIDDSLKEIVPDKIYTGIQNSIKSMINQVLSQYPNAKFYPEHLVSSEKTGTAGLVDLVIDIGNNELIVVDFKTMKYNPVDENGIKNPKYVKAHGKYKAPLTGIDESKHSDHILQTNIYANILEEAGNKVTKIFIIPFIREIDENGMVTKAEVSDMVEISRTKKTQEVADQLMNHTKESVEKINEKVKKYENDLIENGYHEILAKNMADMMKFFMVNNIDTETVTPEQLDNIRGTGISALIASLGDSGFLPKDYNGREFTFEQLFYAAMMPDWDKENIGTYFGEQTISERRVRTRLDPSNPNTKYTGEIDGRKLYVREVKLNELSIGDEVVEIYKDENSEIRKVYKVDRVNRHSLEISEGDKKGILENISGKRSYLKVENEKDIDKEKYNNKLVQVFSANIISEKEYHLNPLKNETGDRKNMFEMSEIWNFFKEIKTINDLRELTNDQERLENWYNRLRILETERAIPLANFIKNSMVSNLFADIIKSEVSEFKAGRPALVSYMIYTMAVDPTKEIHSMFDPFMDNLNPNRRTEKVWDKNLKGKTSTLSTARMLDSSNIPIHLITSYAENAITRTFIDQSTFDEEYKELRKRIKAANPQEFNESRLYDSYGRRGQIRLYKFTSDKSLTPLEREFIKFLHRYHSKYNAEYRFKKQEGQISEPRIKVAANFLQYEEFASKFKVKGKFSRELYEALKPEPYDSIPVKIKGKTMTLGQVKEQFALNILNEKEIDTAALKFNIPVFAQYKNATNEGLVNNVYELKKARHQAMGFYSSGYGKTKAGKLSKISPIHSGYGKDRTSMLATERVVDAEQVHIKAQINKHHMKGIIPIVDWVNMVVNKDDNIGSMLVWIDKWVNYVVHNKRPSGMFDKKLADERIRRAVLQLLKLNSLNKIAWSVKTQLYNFGIGQVMNVVRESRAWYDGWKRMFENPKRAFDIMKKVGLANITDEDYFMEAETTFGKAVTAGYYLMEAAEKANQYPIYVGLMTKDEWSGKTELTDSRMRLLSHKVKAIHGDYSRVSSAPGFETILGSAALQFKKWMPAMVENLFGKYKTTMDGQIKSGIFTTLNIYVNKLILHTEDKRIAKLKELLADPDYNFDINSTRDYLAYLIAKENAGEIKLSKHDIRNLRAIATYIGFLALLMVAKVMTSSDGDDDPRKRAKNIAWLNSLTRLQGDLYWYADVNMWEYMFTNAIPVAGLILNAGKAVVNSVGSLIKTGGVPRYQKESIYAPVDTPKFIVDLTHVVPFGSGMRWVMAKTYQFYKNNNEVIEIDGEVINKSNIQHYDKYGKTVIDLARKGGMTEAQEMFVYLIEEYEKEKKKEQRSLMNAIRGLRIRRLMNENKDFKELVEKGKKRSRSHKRKMERAKSLEGKRLEEELFKSKKELDDENKKLNDTLAK